MSALVWCLTRVDVSPDCTGTTASIVQAYRIQARWASLRPRHAAAASPFTKRHDARDGPLPVVSFSFCVSIVYPHQNNKIVEGGFATNVEMMRSGWSAGERGGGSGGTPRVQTPTHAPNRHVSADRTISIVCVCVCRQEKERVYVGPYIAVCQCHLCTSQRTAGERRRTKATLTGGEQKRRRRGRDTTT